MSFRYDHRQLADEMEICFFDEQIGAGLPLWLPNGVAIRDSLESYLKKIELAFGYIRVSSPHLSKRQLFESSGHLQSFRENMYPPMSWPDENEDYYLKPMNCPLHHKIFAAKPRSYRSLPLRFAEFGQVYRYENSGSLKGLSRVRGLCQNDAHIYINPSEVEVEIEKVLDLHEICYSALGLNGYSFRLSKHDPLKMNDFIGPQKNWIHCENILRNILTKRNAEFVESVGEAAFYGPKIDVQMKMKNGVEESISSIQVDFNSAEKFDLHFINKNGEREQPWVIHRAPLGSHERIIAVLLEYFDGQLPGWLCPIQAHILPIHEKANSIAKKMDQELKMFGIRSNLDSSLGSLSKRLVFARKLRPLYVIVIGEKEVESGQVQLQGRENRHSLSIDQLNSFLLDQIKQPSIQW